LAAGPALAKEKYTIKEVKASVPKDVDKAVAELLSEESIQLLDDNGQVLAQVWLRKELPAKATKEQVKNGLTYREIPETTLIGVVQFTQPYTDYRKTTIKAGVYTLRLGFQPQDGDHMGTAPHSEFCLLSAAAKDRKPETMEPKALQELSLTATGSSHPGIMLLFPSKLVDKPTLTKEENDHFVLRLKRDVKTDKEKATIGIGLTLIGISPSA
jgi:hypothetical protein